MKSSSAINIYFMEFTQKQFVRWHMQEKQFQNEVMPLCFYFAAIHKRNIQKVLQAFLVKHIFKN